MLPEREQPEGEVVARGGAQPLEGGALGEHVRVVGEVGEGRAAPGAQRLLEAVDLRLDLAARRPDLARPGRQLRGERVQDAVPGADLVDERRGVDRATGQRDPVARVRGEQDRRLRARLQARLEQSPQPGHVGVERAERPRRSLAAPDELDEAVRRDDRAEVEREGGEQRTTLARRDLDGSVGPVERGRPEDADLHRHARHATEVGAPAGRVSVVPVAPKRHSSASRDSGCHDHHTPSPCPRPVHVTTAYAGPRRAWDPRPPLVGS